MIRNRATVWTRTLSTVRKGAFPCQLLTIEFLGFASSRLAGAFAQAQFAVSRTWPQVGSVVTKTSRAVPSSETDHCTPDGSLDESIVVPVVSGPCQGSSTPWLICQSRLLERISERIVEQ